jgi:hypothetical protein
MNEHEKIARVLESSPSLLADAEALPPLDGEKAPDGDGAALVRDVESFFSRFVVLPPSAYLPLALWTIGTHTFERFETFPYVALLSPEKRCAKTRTATIIQFLAANPACAVSISEAALFRLIDGKKPTLLLDEAELLTGKGERADAVRAILNAGNCQGVTVPRCVGPSHDLRYFSVFCPKVVCAIRVCPETVKDRAIVIPMQRKKPTEKVERLIRRRIRPEAEQLCTRIANWARANRLAIGRAYEMLDVDFLSDRELENVEPLLAILTACDPSRLGELRLAVEWLASGKSQAAEDDSLSLRLLRDVRAVWQEGEKRVLTSELLHRLKAIEDAPWSSEAELTAHKLARFLAPYGVHPCDVRTELRTGKGGGFERLGDCSSTQRTGTCAETRVQDFGIVSRLSWKTLAKLTKNSPRHSELHWNA